MRAYAPTQSTKSETRNPKQIQSPNEPMTKTKEKDSARRRFGHLDFEIGACFGFRISSFVLMDQTQPFIATT
jgi:hypothetical protein